MAILNYSVKICGKTFNYRLDLPETNQGVKTNRFCPDELLSPNGTKLPNLFVVQNGESIEEFKKDCDLFVSYIQSSEQNKIGNDGMRVFQDAFEHVIVDHINKHGRLIFRDMLLYVDILCYFLYADRGVEDEIKAIYPTYTKYVCDGLDKFVIDTHTLQPIKTSNIYRVLTQMCKFQK